MTWTEDTTITDHLIGGLIATLAVAALAVAAYAWHQGCRAWPL